MILNKKKTKTTVVRVGHLVSDEFEADINITESGWFSWKWEWYKIITDWVLILLASQQENEERRVEGRNINLSLLHLKDIIVKMSKGQK